jgi:hypothetical protein
VRVTGLLAWWREEKEDWELLVSGDVGVVPNLRFDDSSISWGYSGLLLSEIKRGLEMYVHELPIIGLTVFDAP